MAISREQVEHVAHLARLELDPAEKEAYTGQLNSILEYMAILNDLDTSGVEPIAHVLPLANVFRQDEVRDGLSGDKALVNAPEQEGGLFKVPRITA